MTAATPLQSPASARRAGTAFALAALCPGLAAAAGALWGGAWSWLALVAIAAAVPLIDRLAPQAAAGVPGAEFPGSDALLLAIGALCLALLPVTVAAATGPLLTTDAIAPVLAAGLWLGQVGHAAAHELIHRPGRGMRALGVAIYAWLLMGHHASAHRLVHHVHVATPADPNTARAGEGFWAFALRAWAGSLRAGWAAETRRRRALPRGRRGLHPYALHAAGAALALAAAAGIGGAAGVAVWLALALHAQVQILLSDYVQHYGLERRRRPDGRLEPAGDLHAWEARHRASGAMLLAGARHADHHARPARPYPVLAHAPAAPRLPYGLPVMGAIALVPPLWRRVMDPRLARLRARAADAGPVTGD